MTFVTFGRVQLKLKCIHETGVALPWECMQRFYDLSFRPWGPAIQTENSAYLLQPNLTQLTIQMGRGGVL